MWKPSPEEPANWLLLKGGDSEALASFYRQYARTLVNYGYRVVPHRELVRDVVQDLFVQIWANHTTLPEVQSVKAYLMVSVRRQLLQRTAIQQRFEPLPDDLSQPDLGEPSRETQLIDCETKNTISERIGKAIEQLPPRQREVIFLKYYSDLGTQDIADIMGITPASVYKLIYKAIDNLKEQSVGWEAAWLLVTFLLLDSIAHFMKNP